MPAAVFVESGGPVDVTSVASRLPQKESECQAEEVPAVPAAAEQGDVGRQMERETELSPAGLWHSGCHPEEDGAAAHGQGLPPGCQGDRKWGDPLAASEESGEPGEEGPLGPATKAWVPSQVREDSSTSILELETSDENWTDEDDASREAASTSCLCLEETPPSSVAAPGDTSLPPRLLTTAAADAAATAKPTSLDSAATGERLRLVDDVGSEEAKAAEVDDADALDREDDDAGEGETAEVVGAGCGEKRGASSDEEGEAEAGEAGGVSGAGGEAGSDILPLHHLLESVSCCIIHPC